VKYGYQIPWQTDIGSGLAIGHYGTIIVNPNSRIGANCNLSVGVLLGLNHKVDKNGKSLGFKYPMVGDRVSLGNGAKLLGGVTVSSRAVVGVHSVVTHDVGTNYVVVGNPARMISDNGSMAYVGSFHPSSHKYEGLQHL
jgi:serine O-acetyltransferase